MRVASGASVPQGGPAPRLTQRPRGLRARPGRRTATRSRSCAPDGPPQLWLLPAGGGEPEQLTTLPLGAGAPLWSPDGTRIAFVAPVDLRRRRRRGRRRPRQAGRRPDRHRPAGLPGRRRGAPAGHADAPARARPRHRRVRQVTDGDWHAGDPAWSPDSTRLAFAAATAPTPTWCYRAPVHVVDATAARPRPSWSGSPTASPARCRGPRTARPCSWSATRATRSGHAGLLRRRPPARRPADRPRRLPRPQRHARRPGATRARPPVRRGGRRAVLRPRPRLHPPVRRAARRRRAAPGRRTAAGRNVVAASRSPVGAAAIALATPTSFGEIVPSTSRPGDARRSAPPTARTWPTSSCSPARSASSPSATARSCRAGSSATRRSTGPAPLLLDVHGGPHNAWNGAADDMHLYHQELAARGWTVLLLNPRGSDGYGERFYTAAFGGWGELRRPGLPRADRRARRRGHRRPAAARRHRLQLRRLHDLLPHRPRPAVRRRGRRRRGLRPHQHGRHVRRRAPPRRARARRRCRGRRPRAPTPPCRRCRVSTRSGRRRWSCTARPTCAARSARPSSGTPRCASAACRPGWCSTPAASHLFILDGPAVAPHRLQPPGRRLGRAVRRRRAGPRPAPIDAAHWQRRLAALAEAAPGARRRARHPPRRRGGRAGRAGRGRARRAEQGHRRPGHRRLDLPDRLDLEGLDGHGRHAARRRGQARPRHPRRRGAARAPARRRRAHQGRDDPPPAHPHQRHRRRRLHRHRPGRRLPREVCGAARRCRAEPPARRDLVVLQRRLLAGRPVIERLTGGTWDAAMREPALRAARSHAHRDAARGGAAAPRRGRPRRHRGRADPGPRVGPARRSARPG